MIQAFWQSIPWSFFHFVKAVFLLSRRSWNSVHKSSSVAACGNEQRRDLDQNLNHLNLSCSDYVDINFSVDIDEEVINWVLKHSVWVLCVFGIVSLIIYKCQNVFISSNCFNSQLLQAAGWCWNQHLARELSAEKLVWLPLSARCHHLLVRGIQQTHLDPKTRKYKSQ